MLTILTNDLGHIFLQMGFLSLDEKIKEKLGSFKTHFRIKVKFWKPTLRDLFGSRATKVKQSIKVFKIPCKIPLKIPLSIYSMDVRILSKYLKVRFKKPTIRKFGPLFHEMDRINQINVWNSHFIQNIFDCFVLIVKTVNQGQVYNVYH